MKLKDISEHEIQKDISNEIGKVTAISLGGTEDQIKKAVINLEKVIREALTEAYEAGLEKGINDGVKEAEKYILK